MEIQKIFCEIDTEERLYSVLMTEEELLFFQKEFGFFNDLKVKIGAKRSGMDEKRVRATLDLKRMRSGNLKQLNEAENITNDVMNRYYRQNDNAQLIARAKNDLQYTKQQQARVDDFKRRYQDTYGSGNQTSARPTVSQQTPVAQPVSTVQVAQTPVQEVVKGPVVKQEIVPQQTSLVKVETPSQQTGLVKVDQSRVVGGGESSVVNGATQPRIIKETVVETPAEIIPTKKIQQNTQGTVKNSPAASKLETVKKWVGNNKGKAALIGTGTVALTAGGLYLGKKLRDKKKNKK